MCGLVGFLELNPLRNRDDESTLLQHMADQIIHRGPDDAGYWFDRDHRIALGHRRLSIVDLSPAGHQPMSSSSGRYVIAFNGEIYNHLLLRQQLEAQNQAPAWRGHSDTETLLAGFDAWGIEKTLTQTIGMFAWAVWDRNTHTLNLARDRLGEKPLYYGWQGSSFLFASQLKALRVHPAFQAQIDRGALTLLLRHNCIPAPYSIYQGIAKLSPGCYLSLSLRDPEPRIVTYWSAQKAAQAGVAQPFQGNAREALNTLDSLLKDVVRQQMIADVPLGAFLSGGIDSSTIVALMQTQASRPVKTFSIGFHEQDYNEANHALAVARHLGTEHTELYVTAEQALKVIPQLPLFYDEPFSDSSQIPTFLLAQMTRQHVTVSLSGDGGDELFAGYNRYRWAQKSWQNLPRVVRYLIAHGVTRITPSAWNRIFAVLRRLPLCSNRFRNMGNKLHQGAAMLMGQRSHDLYRYLTSHWNDPSAIVLSATEPVTLVYGNRPNLSGLNPVERMMALDLMTYLPDDILVKVDRAAMAVSLETRIPFLDHRVVEFAWSLPLAFKQHPGQSKWLLRQLLDQYVPKALIERPKMGFGLPLDQWLRGRLRDWAEDLLDETHLRQQGFFDPTPIRQKWQEHLSGQCNWQYLLWDVLMFQAWLATEKVIYQR